MIVAAAIKFKPKGADYFQYFCGLRHHSVLEVMHKLGIEYERVSAVQGFMTDDDQFLNRSEAARYAFLIGQLPQDSDLYKQMKEYGDEIYPCELFSEDLW